MPTRKSTRGGTRPGAGRKAVVSGETARTTVVIAPRDRATLQDLGDGVLSLGIQRAAEIVRNTPR